MPILLRQIGIFIIYLFAQVVVFNNLVLNEMATPFVFLLFLLMLPLNIRFPWLILIAFFVGLTVDIFSSGAARGLHAFSCTLMMGLRDLWLMIIANRSYIRGNEDYFLSVQPIGWYINYLVPLILIHHIAYFLLEAFGFMNFGLTASKIIFSALYTFSFCFLLTILFYKSTRR